MILTGWAEQNLSETADFGLQYLYWDILHTF